MLYTPCFSWRIKFPCKWALTEKVKIIIRDGRDNYYWWTTNTTIQVKKDPLLRYVRPTFMVADMGHFPLHSHNGVDQVSWSLSSLNWVGIVHHPSQDLLEKSEKMLCNHPCGDTINTSATAVLKANILWDKTHTTDRLGHFFPFGQQVA